MVLTQLTQLGGPSKVTDPETMEPRWGWGPRFPRLCCCQTRNCHPFTYLIFSGRRNSFHKLLSAGRPRASPVEARRSRDPEASGART